MKTEHLNFHILESVCGQLPDENARVEFWRESLRLSLESLEKNITLLTDAFTSRNLKDLAHAAHKINGTAGFLGGEKISERMLKLQDDCETETISWPVHDEAMIKATLAAVVEEIKDAREKSPDVA